MDLGVDDRARDPVLDGEGSAVEAVRAGAAGDRRGRQDPVQQDDLRRRLVVRGVLFD